MGKLVVLVVDDDPTVRRGVARTLQAVGYETEELGDGEQALERLRRGGIDLLLTDLTMPGLDGIALLERLEQEMLGVPTLVMSGAGGIEDAVNAVRLGAIDYIEKPATRARLEVSLARCLELDRLRDEHQSRREGEPEPLLGESAAMRALRTTILRVAPTPGRVLIRGPIGSGKGLVAKALHHHSARRSGPFVRIDCGALPPDLAESEFFGHERGAFTGAVSMRRGRFERAHEGTLFLDEVGDLPPALQTKLLRVLQEGRFQRVGGHREIQVDVRVVAATQHDLERLVQRGRFREDLFYRLMVVRIDVPPLRHRREDIPALARWFLASATRRHHRGETEFSPAALEVLAAYDYQGHVRELRNVVERLVILEDGPVIDAEAVRQALGVRSTPVYEQGRTLKQHLEEHERRVIASAIKAHGNRSAAARALGVEVSFFYKKCRKLGLS